MEEPQPRFFVSRNGTMVCVVDRARRMYVAAFYGPHPDAEAAAAAECARLNEKEG